MKIMHVGTACTKIIVGLNYEGRNRNGFEEMNKSSTMNIKSGSNHTSC